MRAEEYLRETRARYAEWERRTLDAGRQNALRDLLCELLEQRFGELPADVRDRLDRATTDELRRWGSRVLLADSLAAVFAS